MDKKLSVRETLIKIRNEVQEKMCRNMIDEVYFDRQAKRVKKDRLASKGALDQSQSNRIWRLDNRDTLAIIDELIEKHG